MIEINTPVKVTTIFGTFTGKVYSYDETTEMYKVLMSEDWITTPERRLIGSTIVTPITETQI
jgi:hypothetical protein